MAAARHQHEEQPEIRKEKTEYRTEPALILLLQAVGAERSDSASSDPISEPCEPSDFGESGATAMPCGPVPHLSISIAPPFLHPTPAKLALIGRVGGARDAAVVPDRRASETGSKLDAQGCGKVGLKV